VSEESEHMLEKDRITTTRVIEERGLSMTVTE